VVTSNGSSHTCQEAEVFCGHGRLLQRLKGPKLPRNAAHL
jgi:hypothetical protein